MLLIDGGALLFKAPSPADSDSEQVRLTAAGIVEAYSLMNYDAVGIAGQDLTAGVAFLKQQQSRSSFAWLSANLMDAAARTPIFSPSISLRRGDLDIAVIGITDPGAPLPAGDNAVILPWQEVLPGLVAGLGDRHDMIVLLSSLPPAENRRVAEALDRIHVIVQAGHGRANLTPELVNNTLICQTASQGKYLGHLRIDWQPSATWDRDIPALIIDKRRTLDRLRWQLRRMERKGGPDGPDPDRRAAYQRLAAQEEEVAAAVAELEARLARLAEKDRRPATYENEFLALTPEVPEDKPVKQVVDRLQRQLNELGRRAKAAELGTASKHDSPFVGWRRCAGCHPAAADTWRRSRHAAAYQSLVKRQQQYNLNCLACHVTGIESVGDPAALALADDRLQVGCEVCHGAGRSHAAAPESTRLERRPPASLCTRCHTPEQDDTFDYEADLALISCHAAGPGK